jgi:hypothetical protein
MTLWICRAANFLVLNRVYWAETRAKPWTSAGPRLGTFIGLATHLLAQNLILRENRKIAREPRPAGRMSRSSSLPVLPDNQIRRKTDHPQQLIPGRQTLHARTAGEFVGNRPKPFLK